jgi:thiol-disulfide isomerase/thioredoxin
MRKHEVILVLACSFGLLVSQSARAVSAGATMPECALSPITGGQTAQLSQLKGKVTYVDFWASWCGPCAKSFPFLNQMHQELKERGLQVVGVNLDENLDDGKTFLTNHPAEFTVMADMSADKQCAKDFDVQGMPSSYIIDKSGAVHHVHMGFKDGDTKDIKAMVEKLLQ